jgi:lipid A 4'-phosphatase
MARDLPRVQASGAGSAHHAGKPVRERARMRGLNGMPGTTVTPDPPRGFADRLRREARERPILVTTALLAMVSLVFLAAPQIDLAVSRLFYDPSVGFPGSRYASLEFLRKAAVRLEWALVVAMCAALAAKVVFPDARLPIRPRMTLFVLTSFALGPGLIVNGILKNHWGRARPRQIIDFGGDATFSSVWWISDQCQRNCSFVSGEAASAFWLMAIVFLVPRAWKWPTAILILIFAAAVSLTRIAAGGHFLSDVVIAWLLVLIVLFVSSRLLLQGLPQQFDSVTEAALARAGRALRHVAAIRRSPP